MNPPNERDTERAAFRHGWVDLADKVMLGTFLGAAAGIGWSFLAGEAPHWAAFAGASFSATYLAFPKVRELVLAGTDGTAIPKQAIETAHRCMLHAVRSGEDGIWTVVDHATNRATFLTQKDFEAFKTSLPGDSDLAVIEIEGEHCHVRRFVADRLQSGDDAAHRVYDGEGNLLRAVDYEAGVYAGTREPDTGSPRR